MSTVEQTDTVTGTFHATVARHRDRPALSAAGGAVRWTWKDYGELVRACAAGLGALGCGRGDTVACWLNNRPEFHVTDVAAAHLGAASFSVYPTYTVEQAGYVIGDAGARVLVTEEAFLKRAQAVRAAGRTPLQTIVCVDGGDDTTLTWEQLLERGEPGFDLEAHLAAVTPEDVLTLIYTSGTTGPPKGVELTHANVIAQVAALSERLPFSDGMRAVSWLPIAHIAERLCTHYVALACGWHVVTCSDPRTVTALLPEVRPQIFFSPPRLWEKLRASVLARYDGNADLAAADGHAVLGALGLEQVRAAIVGAAPCPPELAPARRPSERGIRHVGDHWCGHGQPARHDQGRLGRHAVVWR